MINYCIQVLLCQTLFIAMYDLFLSKETFFRGNRSYLLGTFMVSFLLPLAKFSMIKESTAVEYLIMLPEVVISPQRVIEKASWYESINFLNIIFLIGFSFFLIAFLIKLVGLVKLILSHKRIKRNGYTLVSLPGNARAFSFFHFIFIGDNIGKEKKEEIIRHELIHVKQKHSVDLLVFELLRVVMWFNPLVYLYQHRITLVHEYITDAEVSKVINKPSYINNLLSEVFQVESISFINQFYKHSLIKKRIIMMTKKQSKNVKKLKYLWLIPILGGMVVYSSCSEVEARSAFVTNLRKGSFGKINIKGKGDIYLVENKEGETVGYNNLGEKVNVKEVLPKNLSVKMQNGSLVSTYRDTVAVKDVPFSQVFKVPTFPGCVEGDKKCFNEMMDKFMQDNFDMKRVESLNLKQGRNRAYAIFKIGKDGSVYDLKVRAPHPDLKSYTVEVLSKLPNLIPGEDKYGNKVKVGYTLPITFYIDAKNENEK